MKDESIKASPKLTLNQVTAFESSKMEEPTLPAEVKGPSKVKELTWPRKYTCIVMCYVASKAQVFNVGDVAEFAEGEYIPSHFSPLD